MTGKAKAVLVVMHAIAAAVPVESHDDDLCDPPKSP